MKNEAIRSVGYMMIICMQGNSNFQNTFFFRQHIAFEASTSLFPCFTFVLGLFVTDIDVKFYFEASGINLDILKI